MSTIAPTDPLSPSTSLSASLARRRYLVMAGFGAESFGFGLWAGCIPVILRQSDTTQSELGWILMMHVVTFIVSMKVFGHIGKKHPKHLLTVVLPLHAIGFAGLFLSSSTMMLTAWLLAVSVTGGALDITLNSEGLGIERHKKRPMLSRMHACFSIFYAVGAFLGSYLALKASPLYCSAVVIVSVALVWLAVVLKYPSFSLQEEAEEQPKLLNEELHGSHQAVADGKGKSAQPSAIGRIVLIGLLMGTFMGAEMCAQMWSSALMEQLFAGLAAFAGAGAGLFATFQGAGRWFGDPLRNRWGNITVLLFSLGISVLGYLLVAFSPWFVLSLFGFSLIGIGGACLVPCSFSLIGKINASQAASNLATASLVAGAVRLPTPLLLSWMSTHYSFAAAFGLMAVALLVSAVVVKLFLSEH